MNELIKKIREYLDISQTEFADLLNVSFATVNRWENNHVLPNKLAQTQLYELCKEKSVPLYEMILNSITEKAESLDIGKNRVVLYHGSKSGIVGKISPSSRQQCDFGKGFYMGTEPSQGLTLICDFDKSKFYIVSIDISDLTTFEISPNLDWAMVVAYNRGKMEKVKNTAIYNKYREMSENKDVMIGNIANDRMFFVIDSFFIGNITDKTLVHSLSALELGKQYVAKTQKACDLIRIEEEVPLSYLERICIKDIATQNRKKGVDMANEISRKYRREGLYFDEILNESGDEK